MLADESSHSLLRLHVALLKALPHSLKPLHAEAGFALNDNAVDPCIKYCRKSAQKLYYCIDFNVILYWD